MNKMKIVPVLALALMLLSSCLTVAQPLDDGMSKNKKAVNAYQNAYGLINSRRYTDALKHLDKALSLDKYFVAAYDLKSQALFALKKEKEVVENYRTMLKTVPAETRDVKETFYLLATFEQDLEMYDSAIAHFEKFLTFDKVRTNFKEQAKLKLASAKFASVAVKNPVNFNPINLGPGVNTELNEYHPGITLDGQNFIFTRLLMDGGYGNEDFYQSKLVDGKWAKAENLGSSVNTDANEGTITITANGKFIFFTSCNRPKNVGSCDLYFSRYENGEWGEAKILYPPINSPYWDSQPTIAPDGKTLYFTSSRPGGEGGMDLWMATLVGNEAKDPVNLGDVINTNGNETGPCIHADGKTLYFSSDGHPGMGGADFFVTRMDDNGNWSKPENLGYPLNTKADEKGIVISRTGDYAFMASDRKGGYGGIDIYTFELPEKAKAEPVSYVKGYVYDKETNLPIGSSIDLADINTGEKLIEFESDPKTGEFFIILKSNKDYALTIDKIGYLFHSENFSLKQTTKLEPYEIKIGLAKPKNGETIVLNNVLFDTDKFDIKKESHLELDKLVGLLNKNTDLKIQISGHTDNKGSESHNVELSRNRAQAVVDYLISKGISASRLSAKGFGSSKPIATNDTEEGRQLNRRTEMVIL